MPLWRVSALIETDDAGQVERLGEAIEALLCPHPADSDHRCPNRWFILTSELDEGEAAEWEPLLNE